jgi:hypothetical protein
MFMLFVTIGKAKATSTTKRRVARRLNWNYPAGMRMIGEYWLQSNDWGSGKHRGNDERDC